MSDLRFFFYDEETTGLSPEFDQILQIAAVITDQNFNVLETINLRCKLKDYVVPSQGALTTTGLNPNELYRPELTEYKMALEFRDIISKWSPCIFLGYNTINFDEKFLRHIFYRNLLPVYQTQNFGNGRLDILKAVNALHALQPGIIKLGIKEDGKEDRRLETIAPLNGFQNHLAHDALGDVYATIFLAKKIATNAPDFWSNYLKCRDKKSSSQIYLGAKCVTIVQGTKSKLLFPIRPSKDNRGYLCAKFDIKEKLQNFGSECSQIGDFLDPQLYETPVLNAANFVSRNLSVQVDFTQVFDILTTNLEWNKFIESASKTFAPPNADDPIELQIYGGFPYKEDVLNMEEFHNLPPNQKLAHISKFKESKYQSFALRILAQNYRDQLDNLTLARFSDWVKSRLNDPSMGTTADKEIEQIKAESVNFKENDSKFIQLENFYKSIKLRNNIV